MIRFITPRRPAVIAFLFAAVIGLTTTAPADAEEYSDGKLESFVVAWTNINQLAEQWKPKVEAAPSEGEAQQMLQQFEAEVNQVVETTEGIEAEEFESIMRAFQSDPALKERIVAMLENAQPQQ